ncbi:TD and POZ domain-containing protein 5-like [Arvicanthis niloticus]|uniref:TD and POZ domain-containing protein 5-like n=1 Tax=Arvicanthis niloticus TaxID=61156 RepID=UPI0014874D84|nr:TD and POZ domain-containing protein 5-like [Arvicanthis niloticus]XP_034356691.1 TD and POZ domain-containing protein 5-like [Arvicanthis niloticus]XP_034356693.1 TD and POZ domain-containing protein 5-like [Arvicanthis niloticus]
MSWDLEAMSWGYTHISVQEICYKWTISNFSRCMEGIIEKITSPVFSLGASDEVAWCLRVHPNGVDEESKDYLSLFLVLVSCPERPVWAKFQFWITNNRRKKYLNMKGSNVVSFLHNQHRGFKKFFLRGLLFLHQHWLLPEDQLTICCKVSIVGDFFSKPGQNMTPAIQDPRHVLTDDLQELWEKSLFTNCCLLVGGYEFRAHKAILAARSPVFRAMFQHKMKESLTNRVEIQDMDPQVFQVMIDFIYNGKVPDFHSYSMATGVLAAADRYGLEGLLVMCEDSLSKNLSLTNAAHTLILADLHSRKELKAQALKFIALYPFEVSETSGWKSMLESHPHLVAEASHSLASAQCPFLEPSLKRLKRS